MMPRTIPKAPSPTRRDSAAIVEAIVQAAFELGPEPTVERLCERAGVGRASFYRHFKTKDALFAEVVRRIHLQLGQHVAQLMAAEPTEDAAIERCIDLAFALPFLEDDRTTAYGAATIPFEWFAASANTSTTGLHDAITNRLSRDLPEDVAANLAFTLVSLLRGVFRARTFLPDTAPDPAAQRHVLRVMIHAALDDARKQQI
jgi:AcrR family transcriptional regulator